jgi:hypothetical protein
MDGIKPEAKEASSKLSKGKITIRLASVPNFASNEYHQKQVEYYSRFTELVYKALSMDSVASFLKELIEILGISEIEVRVMRLPSYRSKIFGISKKGKILEQQLYGRAWKKKPVVDIFPNRLYLDKNSEPYWSVGLRGFVLNGSIRAVIHELLHKSGLGDETKVRELTERHYKEFRSKHIQTFDDEIKPLVKEWKKFEKLNRT